MASLGDLYLIPVPISDAAINHTLPEYNLLTVRRLKTFICENAKEARRFLKLAGYANLQEAEVIELNEHSKHGDLSAFLKHLKQGESVGLMSDAGCPGIADPGAEIVKLAHEQQIKVIPLVGPSSIVLSIMASGFNGQNFAFVGYLPIEKPLKVKRIKELEQLAQKQHQAQFFIETPYRNDTLLEVLLEHLSPQTRLFVGKELMAEGQVVLSKSVAEWRKGPKLALHKIPVVFGIYA